MYSKKNASLRATHILPMSAGSKATFIEIIESNIFLILLQHDYDDAGDDKMEFHQHFLIVAFMKSQLGRNIHWFINNTRNKP